MLEPWETPIRDPKVVREIVALVQDSRDHVDQELQTVEKELERIWDVVAERNLLQELAVMMGSLFSVVRLHDGQIRHLQDMVFDGLQGIDLRNPGKATPDG